MFYTCTYLRYKDFSSSLGSTVILFAVLMENVSEDGRWEMFVFLSFVVFFSGILGKMTGPS